MEVEGNAGDGGAAPLAAESQVTESTPSVSNEAPAQSTPSTTRREAIDKAFAAVERGEDPPELVQAKPDVAEKPKGERARNPDGTFASSTPQSVEAETQAAYEQQQPEAVQPQPGDEAPSRFSADAKALWKDAPPALKGEIKRAFSELEGGINQYRERLAPYQGMEQFAQIAQQNGKQLANVFGEYYNMENALRRDPINAIGLIMSRVGISPAQYAAHVTGQEPDQVRIQQDHVSNGLRQEIGELKQHISRLVADAEAREVYESQRLIGEFKTNKPRFEELRNDMHFFMSHGKAQTLDEAYALAERLNPGPIVAAPQPAPAPAIAVPSPNPAAQTRKAALSVTGAPAAGSNPAMRKPPSSSREAIDKAFTQVGL